MSDSDKSQSNQSNQSIRTEPLTLPNFDPWLALGLVKSGVPHSSDQVHNAWNEKNKQIPAPSAEQSLIINKSKELLMDAANHEVLMLHCLYAVDCSPLNWLLTGY